MAPKGDWLYPIVRSILFELDPERAHALALGALEIPWIGERLARANTRVVDGETAVVTLARTFSNAVGLAAGLDKNGDHIDALGALGFGHLEIGTVTPKAQQGNPRPRLFRLVQHEAMINRMGFNNHGVDYLVSRAEKRRYKGILGINIGKNAVTPIDKAVDDYLFCLDRVYPVADYVTVNISSPNTRNLRSLQEEHNLRSLVDALKNRQAMLAARHDQHVPLLLKIAPDVDEKQLDAICATAIDLQLEGLIVGNTTLSRRGVEEHLYAREAGGMSGKPLQSLADQRLSDTVERLEGRLPVIGVGGIDSGAAAARKLQLGAKLVQLYSGFIFHGPALVRDCVTACAAESD